MSAELLAAVKGELEKAVGQITDRINATEEKVVRMDEAMTALREKGGIAGAAADNYLARLMAGKPMTAEAGESVDDFVERVIQEESERQITVAVRSRRRPGLRGRVNPAGLDFARALRAVAVASRESNTGKATHDSVLSIVGQRWGDARLAGHIEAVRDSAHRSDGKGSERSLNSAIVGEGAGFVSSQMWGGFVDFLYPQTVVRALGAMTVPVSGNAIDMLYGDVAAGAGYRGQLQAAAETTAIEKRMQLVLKLLSAFMASSNELLDESSFDVDVYIRNLLARAIATAENLAFLRSLGSQNEPRGVDWWTDSAKNPMVGSGHQFNRSLDGGNVTVKTARADLFQAMQVVEEENIGEIEAPGWAMNVATAYGLMRALDTNDRPMFGDEMRGGTLLGAPYRKTTQIVKNEVGDGAGSGTGNKSVVYYADWAKAVIAEKAGVETKVVDGGAYRDSNGNVVTGLTTNETVFVVHAKHDFGFLYRGKEAARIGSVDYASAF